MRTASSSKELDTNRVHVPRACADVAPKRFTSPERYVCSSRIHARARARARAAGAGVLSRRVATDDYTDARNVATVSRSSTSSPLLIAVVRRELCVARRAESPADLRRDTPHASHRARVSRTRVSRRSYGANYPRHFVVTTTST